MTVDDDGNVVEVQAIVKSSWHIVRRRAVKMHTPGNRSGQGDGDGLRRSRRDRVEMLQCDS